MPHSHVQGMMMYYSKAASAGGHQSSSSSGTTCMWKAFMRDASDACANSSCRLHLHTDVAGSASNGSVNCWGNVRFGRVALQPSVCSSVDRVEKG